MGEWIWRSVSTNVQVKVPVGLVKRKNVDGRNSWNLDLQPLQLYCLFMKQVATWWIKGPVWRIWLHLVSGKHIAWKKLQPPPPPSRDIRTIHGGCQVTRELFFSDHCVPIFQLSCISVVHIFLRTKWAELPTAQERHNNNIKYRHDTRGWITSAPHTAPVARSPLSWPFFEQSCEAICCRVFTQCLYAHLCVLSHTQGNMHRFCAHLCGPLHVQTRLTHVGCALWGERKSIYAWLDI